MSYDCIMSNGTTLSRRDERRSKGVIRVVRLEDDDGSFDREFWRNIEPAQRLELVWDMVEEYLSWQENHERQSGLQRSVCRIERR